MKKKTLSVLLAAIMLLTALPFTAIAYGTNAKLPFTDVPDNVWYRDAVQFVFDRNTMNGLQPDEFGPEKNMTRAELATMLSRIAGADVTGYADKASVFNDVSADKWYADYVGWAVEAGVVKGYDDGTFKADNSISRQEIAVMFVRFLGYKDMEIKDPDATQKFTDESDIAKWAEKDVETIRITGLMKGDDDGGFRPDSTATRAEIATIAMRLILAMDSRELELEVSASGSFMSAADFNSWLGETLRISGFIADNYYEIKSKSEALAPGANAELSVKSGEREYTLKVTKKSLELENLLAENGAAFDYTYAGELSNDALASWLRSMADPTTAFDSAEISSIKDNGETSVIFKSGDVEITREYKINLTEGDRNSDERVTLFVSPSGDDSAAGTPDAPLASINGAKAKVRELKKTARAPINVYFRAGDYYISETVEFTAEDSGTETAPVTYAAFRGEAVNFYGGIKLDPSRITKADEAFASRVNDETARQKLLKADLSGLNITLPNIRDYSDAAVFMNDTPLEISRWPNKNAGADAYALTRPGNAVNNEDGSKTIKLNYMGVAARSNLWSDESIKNLYIFGYLAYDWTNDYYDASNFDRENYTVTLKGSNGYFEAVKAGQKRYFFLNLPEEIDVPGESYTDREKNVIYFYPSDDFSFDGMFVSTISGDMISLKDCSNITVDGVNMKYGRGGVVNAANINNVSFSNFTAAHTSGTGMILDGNNISVSNGEIYDFLLGGVIIRGGDRKTLTSSNSIIKNCEIHDINRTEAARSAIQTESTGLVIRNNEIYNCGGEAIDIRLSNDVQVIYNEIYDCATNTGDSGAIYFGRNPSILGVKINYNYFHDIGNELRTSHGQRMIYTDDGSYGAEIHGNVFANTIGSESSACNNHGSQHSDMRGNIFVDVGSAFTFHGWNSNDNAELQDRWIEFLYVNEGGTYQGGYNVVGMLYEAGFDNVVWREHYKDTIWENLYNYITPEKIDAYFKMSAEEKEKFIHDTAPTATNQLCENVFVNVGRDEDGNPYEMGWGAGVICEGNYDENDTSIFESYENKNYALSKEGLAKVREKIPGFENVPFDQMGIIK